MLRIGNSLLGRDFCSLDIHVRDIGHLSVAIHTIDRNFSDVALFVVTPEIRFRDLQAQPNQLKFCAAMDELRVATCKQAFLRDNRDT